MKSLFTEVNNQEIIDRINRLNPQSPAQWGKMHVAQMLAHCQAPLKVAFGEAQLKRSFVGLLFGGIAKKKLIGGDDTPFSKGLPTDRSFVIQDEREFNLEKENLIRLVHRFSQEGPDAISKAPHPFFGKMTIDEWDRLSWKHLDHHLRQFGV